MYLINQSNKTVEKKHEQKNVQLTVAELNVITLNFEPDKTNSNRGMKAFSQEMFGANDCSYYSQWSLPYWCNKYQWSHKAASTIIKLTFFSNFLAPQKSKNLMQSHQAWVEWKQLWGPNKRCNRSCRWWPHPKSCIWLLVGSSVDTPQRLFLLCCRLVLDLRHDSFLGCNLYLELINFYQSYIEFYKAKWV